MTTNRGHSVYQHHLRSCPSAARKDGGRQSGARRGAALGGAPPHGEPADQPDPRGRKPEVGPGLRPRRPELIPREDVSGPLPGFNFRLTDMTPSIPMMEPTGLPGSGGPSTPAEPQPAASKPRQKPAHPRGSEVVAEQIRDELKLQSLRVMPYDVASRCLHLNTNDGMTTGFTFRGPTGRDASYYPKATSPSPAK